MDLLVTSRALDAIRDHAARAAPDECCGLLLGHDGRIDEARPAANVHPEPRIRFTIDPQALIDAHRAARGEGPALLGYYHSHPHGPPAPSATDRAMAAGDGRVWAIAGGLEAGWPVLFWRSAGSGFAALSYALEAR